MVWKPQNDLYYSSGNVLLSHKCKRISRESDEVHNQTKGGKVKMKSRDISKFIDTETQD